MPSGALEGPGIDDVHVGALADHEELPAGGGYGGHRRADIRQQQDVAVDVAKNVVARDGLCAGKHVVEALGAQFAAFDVGFVAKAKLASGFGGAFIRAKENDLYPGCSAFQDWSALRWMIPMCPRKGFAVVKKVSTPSE